MKNKKNIITLFLLLFFPIFLFASSIEFSGGYTTLSMKEENKKITLSNSANVKIDDLTILADSITLSGDDYNYIECTGNVKFQDSENEITLRCSSLKYYRDKNQIIIDGWVEFDDLKNSIYATATYLEYDTENSILDLSVEVKLLHSSDDDIMKCSCDILRVNLEDKNISLLGNSSVIWQDNTYKANAISINLNNNDISMDGSIEANITTK